MAAEELLKLFDEIWSERPIFKKERDLWNREAEVLEAIEEEEEEAVKNIPVRLLGERAMSDETMMASSKKGYLGSSSSSNDLFLSPRSVLNVKPTPTKLQTILSGKEVNEFTIAERERLLSEVSQKKKNDLRRRKKGKSMSDLEYEELKGFMDLGFVFSEEDHKDSDLVSIIPGLQSLLKKDSGVTEEEGNRVARPYLSEAWDNCGGRKGRKQSMPEIKWRIPVPVEKEVDLKDHLKQWAHAVASTIR